jgi:hypothetical protein
MSTNLNYNTPVEFENLYKILSSPRFLNKEGLGGELPFFIHSFPVNKLSDVENNTEHLIKRLQSEGVEILEINLYFLCIDILKREDIFDKITAQEKSWSNKQRLLRILSGPLNTDTILIPEIHKRLAETNSKILLLTGIGASFPFIRSHTILNNLQTLVGNIPLVMLFPGTYNNQSLKLFDCDIKDENYYRAHNLNEYKI